MSSTQGATAADSSKGTPRRAGVFDIRTFIATLLGLYGLVLIAMGLFSTSDYDLNRSDDININLWAGIALVVAAAILITWARLRPLIVPADTGSEDHDDAEEAEEDRPPAH
jgi:uncharacterized membrane protein